MEVIDWLMRGDPAIRWQTMRDLLGAPAHEYEQERAKVASQGWGARLLRKQDAGGLWAGGLYTPKWTSATYTMLVLRLLGLEPGNPQAMRTCRVFLDRGLYSDGGINFFARYYRYSETCITGMILSILGWFRLEDPRISQVADHLLGQQMADGGWNCQYPKGATHGSFHTTILALEGLRCYDQSLARSSRRIRAAEAAGREFLLRHRLYRSHRTGKVVKSGLTRFPFPPQWHYDVLRGLDYFRESGAGRDARLEDAIEVVARHRGEDGRWTLPARYPGHYYFAMEKRGAPSRWNTLRAMRVLGWWNKG